MWVFIFSRLEKTAGLIEKATICFFLFLTCNPKIPPFGFLLPSAAAIPDRKFLAQVLHMGVYAIMFFILAPKIRMVWKNRAVVSKDRFLWILLIFVLVSTLWSIDPQVTLLHSLMLLVVTGFAVFLGVNYNWREIMGFLYVVFIIVTCASVVIRHAGMLPTTTPEQAMAGIQATSKGISGITAHPNDLGALMSFSIILWCVYILQKGKYSWLAALPIILSSVLLVKASSMGAVLTLFITMVPLVWVTFVRRFGYNRALAATILFSLVAGGMLILLISNLEFAMSFIGKDLTLSGRTGLWQVLWERVIGPHPLFGNGYAAFFQAKKYVAPQTRFIARYLGDFGLWHGHNGFMHLLVDLGFFGVILFIVSLFRNIFKGIKYLHNEKEFNRVVPIVFLTFFIFINISENRILTLNIYWILYVVTSVRLSMESIKTNAAEII
jgi:O-antigen ligase